MKEQLEFFKKNGYLVVPGALSTDEVRTINAAIDRDRAENQPLWQDRGESGRYQNVHTLLAQPDLDITMRPPGLLPLMEAIMGSDLCAEEHSVMVRSPNPDGPTMCHWHRDAGDSAEPPYYTRYLSVVFYLTDVDDTTHTFSVLPGTAQSAELLPLDAYDLSTAVHLVGRAGTAILFNAATFHAGNVRRTRAERRTIHIYCGHARDRYLSNHTIFPRRLWEGADEATRKYYSRPNPITRLLMDRF
ncbi:MAG: phytanoyl-CoA dioxygenase family protein [Candidatus Poribacteria bacterium]|nr:phytanoyl-CoA dioxygenase family protein [Candidatus Poribacteria bacterium]